MTHALRALIVEDDFAVAHVTRRFVEQHPRFEAVAVAGTGADALKLIGEIHPDAVLLDMYLPDMSGTAVLARARAAGSRAEVIAVTAARDLETVRFARAHGVHHYLVKPFRIQLLHERLDDVWKTHMRDQRLRAEGELDQTEVDAILRRDAIAAAGSRKGVSSVTLETVAQVLADAAGRVSAAEVADALGMSRVSARRYLERLVESDLADRAPRYGGPGRPELLYSARR
ncbi:response regulator [Agromyces archimandritae]|uniref:Transcriptional regulatory protein n=1 Tax=Agromyces archimandritae TaxID=2781962 RepID=A0A975FKK0_9MICO|nr:response regulator [Agromyces archimandritae]QTX03775.1 response regulator [Agromyces archimandritae]